MIIVSRFWTNLFSCGKANAITIYPFIFLKSTSFKQKEELIRHERIHLRQAIEFTLRFIQFKDFDKAYRRISFEREAYDKEGELDYLSRRKFWAFWRYL